MEVSAKTTNLKDIVQVIHDSIHERPGWSDEYILFAAGAAVGYGSVAVGGPWKEKPTAYEFYVVPHHRLHLFDLFRALLSASDAGSIEVQSRAMTHSRR